MKKIISSKTHKGLKSCLGLLKKDKESRSIEKSLKKGWKTWNKRYNKISYYG